MAFSGTRNTASHHSQTQGTTFPAQGIWTSGVERRSRVALTQGSIQIGQESSAVMVKAQLALFVVP